ncbi:hypothetical protein ACA910_016544 [Epithemia clementina (nom. ined.)]
MVCTGKSSSVRTLTAALILHQLLTFVGADDVTPPPATCSFCPEEQAVNAPARAVTIDLGPPFGEATRTCREFEQLIPFIQEPCPVIPPEAQEVCLCQPFLGESPTGSPNTSPTFFPTPVTTPVTPPASAPVAPLGDCACQPAEYFFELDFTAPCPEVNPFDSEGVQDATCSVNAGSDDTVFDEITTVFAVEIDQNGDQVNPVFFNGPFLDGTVLVYKSIIASDVALVAPPRSIRVILRGANAEGFAVLTQWEVIFTNSCDVYPVIVGGEVTVGTVIAQVGAPPVEYCPLAAMPTQAPATPPGECACQPAEYVFELDFTAPCPEVNPFDSEGVANATCTVTAASDDTTFDEITSVIVAEYDQNGDQVNPVAFDGPFLDGAVLAYQSIIASNADLVTLPRSIRVNLRGANAGGLAVSAQWEVTFTNSCDVYPVIVGGEVTVGTIIAQVGAPPVEYCPLAAMPTQAPSTPPGECACQPAEYVFELDFTAPCPEVNPFDSEGVADATCTVTAASDDTTFDEITSVIVAEYDQNGDQVNPVAFDGPFLDGAVLAYQSIIASNADLVTLPRSIRVNLRGANAGGLAVSAQWEVTFTNSCDVYPVIVGGEVTVGTIIAQVGAPPVEYCPLAPTPVPPTQAPSTLPPSLSPVSSPVAPPGECACQPAEYDFELDFTAPCPEVNPFDSEGVADATCTVTAASDDTTFVEITTVIVAEFDQNGDQVNSVVFDEPFLDGALLVYQSIIASDDELAAPPRSIRVTLRGANAGGLAVSAQWEVTFTNSCDVYPVIVGGEVTVGTVIAQVGAPPAKYCPLAATPVPLTQAPSSMPSSTMPTTSSPTTSFPTTSSPTTSSPTTSFPTTTFPTTSFPTTSFPTSSFPSSSLSSSFPSGFPSSEEIPSSEFPSSEFPSSEFPSSELPTTPLPSKAPVFTPPTDEPVAPSCPPIHTVKKTKGKKDTRPKPTKDEEHKGKKEDGVHTPDKDEDSGHKTGDNDDDDSGHGKKEKSGDDDDDEEDNNGDKGHGKKEKLGDDDDDDDKDNKDGDIGHGKKEKSGVDDDDDDKNGDMGHGKKEKSGDDDDDDDDKDGDIGHGKKEKTGDDDDDDKDNKDGDIGHGKKEKSGDDDDDDDDDDDTSDHGKKEKSGDDDDDDKEEEEHGKKDKPDVSKGRRRRRSRSLSGKPSGYPALCPEPEEGGKGKDDGKGGKESQEGTGDGGSGGKKEKMLEKKSKPVKDDHEKIYK